VARVDALVLSNGDADHAGVPAALLRAVPVAAAYSGEPARIADLAPRHCHAGQEWQWDGVHFRFLNPADPALAGNDASCVLQVRSGDAGLLLTGDIGASVERRLVAQFATDLRADVVQVAHHGSRTSSDPGFVAAVQPRLAVFSTGYRNRFGFPKPDVVERWRRQGAEVLDTQSAGAITVELGPGGLTGAPRRERAVRQRYWRTD
jgi:competence protein ComEC